MLERITLGLVRKEQVSAGLTGEVRTKMGRQVSGSEEEESMRTSGGREEKAGLRREGRRWG